MDLIMMKIFYKKLIFFLNVKMNEDYIRIIYPTNIDKYAGHVYITKYDTYVCKIYVKHYINIIRTFKNHNEANEYRKKISNDYLLTKNIIYEYESYYLVSIFEQICGKKYTKYIKIDKCFYDLINDNIWKCKSNTNIIYTTINNKQVNIGKLMFSNLNFDIKIYHINRHIYDFRLHTIRISDIHIPLDRLKKENIENKTMEVILLDI